MRGHGGHGKGQTVTCYEESIWQLKDDGAIEYRARIARSDPKASIGEFYELMKPGDPKYQDLLNSALSRDSEFLRRKSLSVNLVYDCISNI